MKYLCADVSLKEQRASGSAPADPSTAPVAPSPQKDPAKPAETPAPVTLASATVPHQGQNETEKYFEALRQRVDEIKKLIDASQNDKTRMLMSRAVAVIGVLPALFALWRRASHSSTRATTAASSYPSVDDLTGTRAI